MRFFKSRRGNLLLFLALLAPAGLLMPPSPDRRPAWAGPGHYRLLVKVEPYDTDGRDQDEGVAEFVLRYESAIDRAAEDQDVEPARVIADEQAVAADRSAGEAHARADDPRGRAEEPSRPSRAAEQPSGQDMQRSADQEQQQQAGNARGRAGVQVHAFVLNDRG